MEGIDNPAEIRDLILERVRGSRTAGLGDERVAPQTSWNAARVEALREIRDLVRANPGSTR